MAQGRVHRSAIDDQLLLRRLRRLGRRLERDKAKGSDYNCVHNGFWSEACRESIRARATGQAAYVDGRR